MFTRTGKRRRGAALAVAAVLTAGTLAGCGSGSSSGPVHLMWYAPNDSSGSYKMVAESCSKKAHGRYTVSYQALPNQADQQRQQLVRRLAARDSSMDLMGMDITWEAEFAEAGWLQEWTGQNKATAENGILPSMIDTAVWKGKLYAAPFVTNAQLLWYRSDLVKTPPATWDQLISAAQQLAKQGKPHYVEEQGAQYEGVTVWFNSLIESAGGSVLTPDSSKPSMGEPAVRALDIMHRLATTSAGDPALASDQEDQGRFAVESGRAAFELNWPGVYASMQTDDPVVNGVHLKSVFKWAPYPAVIPGKPARVTTGGVDNAVSKYTKHKALAFQAALCLSSVDSQKIGALQGGTSPSAERFYTHPDAAFVKAFPFYQDVYAELKIATNRPKTPAYQSVSLVISHAVSPSAKIDPRSTVKSMTSQISDALQSKGMVP